MEIIFRETRRCESIKILDTARKRIPRRRSLSFDYTFEPLASSSATNTAAFAHALHTRRNTRKVRSDSSCEGKKLSRTRLERPALKSLECFEARTILLFRWITLRTLDREKFRVAGLVRISHNIIIQSLIHPTHRQMKENSYSIQIPLNLSAES